MLLFYFFFQIFWRLTFNGIPSVVNIGPAVVSFIILSLNKKGETCVSPFFKYYEFIILPLPNTKSFVNFSAIISPPIWISYNSSLKYFRMCRHMRHNINITTIFLWTKVHLFWLMSILDFLYRAVWNVFSLFSIRYC